jgi:hypothetical protein
MPDSADPAGETRQAARTCPMIFPMSFAVLFRRVGGLRRGWSRKERKGVEPIFDAQTIL